MTIQQSVFELKRREFVSPNLIRIYLTGEDIEKFEHATLGENNKLFIPSVDYKDVQFPVFDNDKKRWDFANDYNKPYIRTYTHRGIDLQNREMIIDFAYHGDVGPASAWAANAQKGDKLGVAMKLGKGALYPESDNYILVGDITAIPVLSVILETLPEGKQVKAFFEVPSEQDKIHIDTKANAQIEWIVNEDPVSGSPLSKMVINFLDKVQENTFIYAASEYRTIKELRMHLRKQLNWPKEQIYAYSYWKAGQSEQDSEASRREERSESN